MLLLPQVVEQSLSLFPQSEDGTLLYAGPSPYNVVPNVTDFLSLETRGGRLRLSVNFGGGSGQTRAVVLDQRVDDGREHFVVVRWTNDTVQASAGKHTFPSNGILIF